MLLFAIKSWENTGNFYLPSTSQLECIIVQLIVGFAEQRERRRSLADSVDWKCEYYLTMSVN